MHVVAETGAATKLVGEGGNVRTLGNARGDRSSQRVNRPLNEGGGCLALGSRRKNRSFLRSEDGQDVGEVFTIGDAGPWIGSIVGIRKIRHDYKVKLFTLRVLKSAESYKVLCST